MFIKIQGKSFAYKDFVDSPFSRLFIVYYKTFLGLFRVSELYSSYSTAEKAPIKLFVNRHDYSKYTIWK